VNKLEFSSVHIQSCYKRRQKGEIWTEKK